MYTNLNLTKTSRIRDATLYSLFLTWRLILNYKAIIKLKKFHCTNLKNYNAFIQKIFNHISLPFKHKLNRECIFIYLFIIYLSFVFFSFINHLVCPIYLYYDIYKFEFNSILKYQTEIISLNWNLIQRHT